MHGNKLQPHYETHTQQKCTLGDRHPKTLICISNMGDLLKVMGQLKEARPLFEEALQAQRETLGESHSGTLISKAWLDKVNYALL